MSTTEKDKITASSRVPPWSWFKPKQQNEEHFPKNKGGRDNSNNNMDVRRPASPKPKAIAQQNANHGRTNKCVAIVQDDSTNTARTTAGKAGVHTINRESSQTAGQSARKPTAREDETALCTPVKSQPDTLKDRLSIVRQEDGVFSLQQSATDEKAQFERSMEEPQKAMENWEIAREALEQRISDQKSQHVLEIHDLNKLIAGLRTRLNNAAERSANVPTQAPLSRPESQLRNEWRELTYDLRNLVANHFQSGRWRNKIPSWAKINNDFLCQVTPKPVEVASCRKSGSALVEAAIWKILTKNVFGEPMGVVGPMRWAGNNKRSFQRLVFKVAWRSQDNKVLCTSSGKR
ncbi:hypothetical protein K4K59_002094 [Colletotrichum sp. SAR11_240]|nr:hypothetical protein K4K59_002094 [Colletotrichum sp. SAR11_240]